MTKHRKILDGVSEGPWDFIVNHQDHSIYWASIPGVASIDNKYDSQFIVYARNQWPAICDLIEAATSLLSRPPPEKGCDIEIDQDFVDGWFLAKEALDKLNED